MRNCVSDNLSEKKYLEEEEEKKNRRRFIK